MDFNPLVYLFTLDFFFRSIIPNSFRHPTEISNRMVCVVWQIWTVSLSISNLITEPWNMQPSYHTLYMENQMISYFIYDLIILTSTKRGRKQIIFYVHHFISLLIAYLNRSSNQGTNFISNSYIILLEITTPLLNLSKIMEEIIYVPYLNYFTIQLYLFSRIYCFFPWIVYYIMFHFQYSISNYIILFSSMALLLGSIKWYSNMKLILEKTEK